MARAPRRIVVVSDTHCGSVMGLCPPIVTLEGGGEYRVNKYQSWLWACWLDMIEQVEHLDKPILVINGDALQGQSPKDGQLIGSKRSTQVDIGKEAFAPLVKACSTVYYVRGTEWHEGPAAQDVEGFAASMGAKRKDGTGQHTRSELYLDLGGQVIHFAHHIQNSSVPHYESTIPAREALIQTSELVRFFGPSAPNLRMVVRSHRHRSAIVWLPPDLYSLVTPAFQLKTSFSYKVAAAMLPEIGWTLIESMGGKLRPTVRLYPIQAPHVEVA